MHKIGIVVNDLTASSLSFHLIHNLHNLINKQSDISIVIFSKVIKQPLGLIPYPVMSIEELWCFDGVVICFDIESMFDVQKFVGPKQYYLYAWELDWFKKPYQFNIIKDTYLNENINLITRSVFYQNIISRIFKRNVAVVSDMNIDSLLGVING